MARWIADNLSGPQQGGGKSKGYLFTMHKQSKGFPAVLGIPTVIPALVPAVVLIMRNWTADNQSALSVPDTRLDVAWVMIMTKKTVWLAVTSTALLVLITGGS